VFGLDPGLAMAVLSALVLGVYLFVVKRYFADYPATVYVALSYAFALLWYLPVGATRIDGGLLPTGFGTTGVAVLLVVLGGTVVGVLTVFRALATGDVSYVAPISKLVPVFVLPLELLLLDEHLAPLQLAGVATATAAVYVANYEPGHLLDPFRQAARSRPAQLALVSAAAFGVVDTGKRTLVQELAMAPAAFVLVLFVTLPVALAPLAARNWPGDVRRDLPMFALTGLLLAVANHATMLSFSALPASLASPVVNTQAVVAVVLGGVLLDEDAFRVRLVAAALAVLGVALITIG